MPQRENRSRIGHVKLGTASVEVLRARARVLLQPLTAVPTQARTWMRHMSSSIMQTCHDSRVAPAVLGSPLQVGRALAENVGCRAYYLPIAADEWNSTSESSPGACTT